MRIEQSQISDPAARGAVYRFGVFELNPASRQLSKAGREVRLQEQPLRLLALLLERPNEIRTREELQRLLWPTETFLEFDDGLNTAIQKIRQVLGDEARNPRFVETVPRQGYRFIAPVQFSQAPPATEPPTAAVPTATVDAPPTGRKRLWLAAAAAAIVCIATGWLLPRPQSATPNRPLKLSVTPPPHVELRTGVRGGSAISMDGQYIVFAGSREGKHLLWVRGLHTGETRELPGTEGAVLPFWSPDNKSIGFLAAGQLRRIDLAGGHVADLVAVPRPTRGSWMDNGAILFAAGPRAPIQSIKATGGPATNVTPDSPRGSSWPSAIPGSNRFLYFNNTTRHIELAGDGQPIPLVTATTAAVYAPPYDGLPAQVLTLRGTTLIAQPFAPTSGKLTGEAIPVAEDVGFTDGWRYVDLSVSSNGVLLYGSGTTVKARLAWFRRDGSLAEYIAEPDWIRSVRLSPDGRRALIERGMLRNLWVFDFDRKLQTRATFEEGPSGWPVWSPDGTQIGYSGERGGRINLFLRKAGAPTEERLVNSEYDHYLYDWSRDGKYAIYCEINPQTKLDLWILPLTPGAKPRPFLKTPFNEDTPRLSEDNRWVAYASDESGRNEIYVTSFPSGEGKWQISNTGGILPRWSADSREIFYESTDGQIMSVPVRATGTRFESSTPKKLFANPLPGRHYEVSPRGDRFLMMTPAEGHTRNELTVIVNWQAALKH